MAHTTPDCIPAALQRMACAAIAAIGATLSGAALAADVYRWIDDEGRTQISDQPPAKRSGAVTKSPMPKEDVSPVQRRAAQQRTERDKAQLKGIEDDRRRAATKARKPAGKASSAEEEAGLPPRGSAEDCRN